MTLIKNTSRQGFDEIRSLKTAQRHRQRERAGDGACVQSSEASKVISVGGGGGVTLNQHSLWRNNPSGSASTAMCPPVRPSARVNIIPLNTCSEKISNQRVVTNRDTILYEELPLTLF